MRQKKSDLKSRYFTIFVAWSGMSFLTYLLSGAVSAVYLHFTIYEGWFTLLQCPISKQNSHFRPFFFLENWNFPLIGPKMSFNHFFEKLEPFRRYLLWFDSFYRLRWHLKKIVAGLNTTNRHCILALPSILLISWEAHSSDVCVSFKCVNRLFSFLI